MEWLDIYDEHGNRTGKTAERGTFLSKGEYFLCAHVILENTDGLSLQDCTMQESEVQDLRLVTQEELLDLLEQMSHRSPNYKRRLTEFLSHRS